MFTTITMRPNLPFALMLRALRRDINFIGCMTDADLKRCWWNGKSADRAKLPGVSKGHVEVVTYDPEARHRAWVNSQMRYHRIDRIDYPDGSWDIETVTIIPNH